MRFLRKGEYDLVNISLIGFDPVTGRDYDTCKAEWDEALKKLRKRQFNLKWWDVPGWLWCRWQGAVLAQRSGFCQ